MISFCHIGRNPRDKTNTPREKEGDMRKILYKIIFGWGKEEGTYALQCPINNRKQKKIAIKTAKCFNIFLIID